MKKLALLLASSFIIFTGCEFINTKILGKPSQAEIEQMRQDSINRVDSINQARIDSIEQAKADSLAAIEQAKADSLAAIQAEKNKNRYHVVTGSFKTENYAEKYMQRMVNHFGYKETKIVVANNGFNLVSVQQFPSLGRAYKNARYITEQGTLQAWVHEDK